MSFGAYQKQVTIGPIAPGATVTITHGIGLIPDKVEDTMILGDVSLTYSNFTITTVDVTNSGLAPNTTSAVFEYVHSAVC